MNREPYHELTADEWREIFAADPMLELYVKELPTYDALRLHVGKPIGWYEYVPSGETFEDGTSCGVMIWKPK